MGTCPTVRGKVTGSLPPGTASPNSTSARAGPVCTPRYHASTIAGTCSASHGIASGRPFISTATVGFPAALLAGIVLLAIAAPVLGEGLVTAIQAGLEESRRIALGN